MNRIPAWQRERDRILREAGFIDLEDERGQMDPVIRPRSHITGRNRTPEQMDTLAEYYQQAGQILHGRKWTSPVERRAWELHSEGASFTRIHRTILREMTLGTLPRERWYRRRAFAIVTKVREELLGKPNNKVKGRPGRKVDPDSMRQHGVVTSLRLDAAAAVALDHLVQMGWSKGRVIRTAILLLAKMHPVLPQSPRTSSP